MIHKGKFILNKRVERQKLFEGNLKESKCSNFFFRFNVESMRDRSNEFVSSLHFLISFSIICLMVFIRMYAMQLCVNGVFFIHFWNISILNQNSTSFDCKM